MYPQSQVGDPGGRWVPVPPPMPAHLHEDNPLSRSTRDEDDTVLDWSDFEDRYVAVDISKEPYPELIRFPEGDLAVVREPRTLRTINSTVPDDVKEQLPRLRRSTRDIIEHCMQDWVYVQHYSSRYGTRESRIMLNPSNEGRSTLDITQKPETRRRSPTASTADFDLLRPFAPATDIPPVSDSAGSATTGRAASRSNSSRRSIFGTIRGAPKGLVAALSGSGSDSTPASPVQSDRASTIATVEKPKDPFSEGTGAGMQLLMTWRSLKFELGSIEPFFCAVALYDVRKRTKLSEDVYYEVVADELGTVYGQPELTQPLRGGFRRFIFTLYETSEDIYLVLRVFKLLRGDPEKDTAPYLKPKALKRSQIDALAKETTELLTSRVHYLQPFAWAAAPLFDASGALQLGVASRLDELVPYRAGPAADDAIFDALAGDREQKKGIPAEFNFDVVRLDKEELPGRLNPSLCPVRPPSPMPHDTPRLIRELQEFPANPGPQLTQYVNNLYVYPRQLVLKGESKANIQVEVRMLERDDNPKAEGLRVFYDRFSAGSAAMVTSDASAVSFHERKPFFCEEFKLRLPSVLTAKHHLLFTFYHVTPKKAFRLSLGSAAFPLLSPDTKRVVRDGEHKIPVMFELAPDYLDTCAKYVSMLNVKQPKFFVFHTRLVSSIYPLDDKIETFFDEFSRDTTAAPPTAGPAAADSLSDWSFALSGSLTEAMRGLASAELRTVMGFFPALLSELFELVATSNNTATAKEALLAAVNLIRAINQGTNVKSSKQNPLLQAYVSHVFDTGRFGTQAAERFHERLCQHWLVLLDERHTSLDGFAQIGVLLDILTKAMTLHLHRKGTLATDSHKDRFTPEFMASLSRLVHQLLLKAEQQGLDFITSFPMFIRELFHLVDRGAVFNMIYRYVCGDKPQGRTPALTFSTLPAPNVDLAAVANPSIAAALAGSDYDNVLLVTIKFTFLRVITDYEHYVPLNLPVEDVIESTTGLQKQFWKRHFLSGLLLHEVGQCLGSQQKPVRSQAIRAFHSLLLKLDSDDRYLDLPLKERVVSLHFPFIVLLIENLRVIERGLLPNERQTWLICFLYVIRNCRKQLLRSWWKKETQSRQTAFFNLLLMCLDVFGAPPEAATNSALSTSGSVTHSDEVWLEVAQVAVEILWSFTEDFASELNVPGNFLLEKLFEVVERLLQRATVPGGLGPLEEPVVGLVYPLLEHVIGHFPAGLFGGFNNYCEVMAHAFLRHSNLDHPSLRERATGLLFALVKANWAEAKTLSHVQTQATVAVSKLVGSGEMKSFALLRTSLESIAEAARSTPDLLAAFEELTRRVFGLIVYSIRIGENAADPEMTADLYYSISNGYADTPDLRVTWLLNLANYHVQNKQLEEAAQCKLHVVHLIAQYLKLYGDRTVGTGGTTMASVAAAAAVIDSSLFLSVCPNAMKELPLPNARTTPADVYRSPVWNLGGLIRLLQEAADHLQEAQNHSASLEVYTLLLLLYKKARDYPHLIECLDAFKSDAAKLIEVDKENTRVFSRYYRVGFYGTRWEELDGKEFIYKRPPTDTLPNFQKQLKTQFAARFKIDPSDVVVLPNKEVDRALLDPRRVYLQLGSVTPYFDKGDDRVTLSEKNFNTNKFIFEISFITEGSAKNIASDMSQQRKRKMIYTSILAFPYVKTRLEIIDKKEIILSPIENAIEVIEDRVGKLRAQLECNPPRVNQLQQVLQGSVVPMVNEGPLVICQLFLGQAERYEEDKVELLCQTMTNFIKLCAFAIKLNKSIIGPEMMQFHSMIESHYNSMAEAVKGYIAAARRRGTPRRPSDSAATAQPSQEPSSSSRRSTDADKSATPQLQEPLRSIDVGELTEEQLLALAMTRRRSDCVVAPPKQLEEIVPSDTDTAATTTTAAVQEKNPLARKLLKKSRSGVLMKLNTDSASKEQEPEPTSAAEPAVPPQPTPEVEPPPPAETEEPVAQPVTEQSSPSAHEELNSSATVQSTLSSTTNEQL